ncbi:hypothetical protein AU476_18205 [Cupriavidus sp. UYMSc13B]|nr:hypothetical protein AU476_18205 [Cupriavidus sp. UYMSc13B]
MEPTYIELQKLRNEFPADTERMQRCLADAGIETTADEVVLAWAKYSDELFAGWLELPEDDATLVRILLKQLASPPPIWHITTERAADGSGDLIVQLPPDLCAQLGWAEGNELVMEKLDAETLTLRRV